MKGKEFPLFELWEQWFRKDRATGEGAVGFDDKGGEPLGDYEVDMEGILDKNDKVTSDQSGSQRNPTFVSQPSQTADASQNTLPYSETRTTNGSPYKRKKMEKGERAEKIARPYINFMQKYWEEYKVILQDMNSKLVSPDVVFHNKTTTVIEALK